MGAPQGTAGPLKPRGERYLRTDRTGSTAVGKTEELGEKKFKTQPCKQKGKERRRRGGGTLSAKAESLEGDNGGAHGSPTGHEGPQWSRHPPAAHGGPHATASGDALKGPAACAGEPTPDQVYQVCSP